MYFSSSVVSVFQRNDAEWSEVPHIVSVSLTNIEISNEEIV
jgi:hypothetical protein